MLDAAYGAFLYGYRNPTNPIYEAPIPDLTPFFPHGSASFVLHTGSNGTPLQSPLHVFYCPTSYTNGHPINRALVGLIRGMPAHTFLWAGHVVVMKFSDVACRSYVDFTPADVPHVQSFFALYSGPIH